MGDFNNDAINRTARKQHKCTYCAEGIAPGEQYVFQKGNYDGAWYESKMHPECFADLCESGDGEYLPYSNERPRKAIAATIPAPVLIGQVNTLVK